MLPVSPKTARGPGRGLRFRSPPKLGPKLPPAGLEDRVDLSRARPPEPASEQRLGEVALGLLSLGGVIAGGAAGARLLYQYPTVQTVDISSQELALEAAVYDGNTQGFSDLLVRNSYQVAPERPGQDRLLVNRTIQTQRGDQVIYDGSPVVLISFNGTFAHEPHRIPVMQQLGRELQSQGVNTASEDFKPAELVSRSITTHTGRPTRWSGPAYGVLQDIVRDPELNNNIQILSFPSEELEAFSDGDAWRQTRPVTLAGEIYRTAIGRPRNVEDALRAVREIQSQAREQGKSPTFVVISHSSGGTSAVKFAQRLGDTPLDLVTTIDPVKEAHFAFGEGLVELGKEGWEQGVAYLTDRLAGFRVERHTPTVRSRTQPGTLHTTSNVSEWVNFYQTSDLLGAKMGPQLGIHGSPVVGAENIHVEEAGEGGHGSIALEDSVGARILSELRERVRNAP